MRGLTNYHPIQVLAFLIGVSFITFQVWLLFSPQQALIERPIHLSTALILLFLYRPLKTAWLPRWSRVAIDTTLVLAAAAVLGYYLIGFERLTTRMENVSPVYLVDLIFGVLLVFLLLEGARRAVGWILVWVLLAFIAYAFWGDIFPGWLNFRGFGIESAIEISSMTTAGILGITTSTSVSFIFYFILFGAFYAAVGGGQLFIDLAIRATGRATGGTAKAAIIGSSLMGSISGSAVSNVVSTGVFTIPLMKRTGVPGYRAAGIEAIASTGGQLMPPVMGVAAFIMAEFLGIPYTQVALAGLIPAIAFYLALILVVDLTARRGGVRPLSDEEVAQTPAIAPRLHLIAPLLILIFLLVSGYSASYSAVVAAVTCLIVPFLRRSTRIGIKEMMQALREAPRQAAEVAVPIAAIGIVIAVAVQSNLALKFAGSLLSLSEGSIYASLMVAMVGCIIMGMGLPTVAAYIIGAVLFVPAIEDLGIPSLAAHFFVFYYCVLSMVTPPVALASFAAAGVGQASAMKTSLSAFGLSLVAFFVPFAFVFDVGVLAQGSATEIVFSAMALLLATALWAVAFGGWAGRPLGIAMRSAIGLAGFAAVISPSGSVVWGTGLISGWALIGVVACLSRCRRGHTTAITNTAE